MGGIVGRIAAGAVRCGGSLSRRYNNVLSILS